MIDRANLHSQKEARHKIPEDVPLNAADTFVYGAVMGPGGTCASLPVLYATVGQYLGYPTWLVSAKTRKWTHRFVRWHDQRCRFNIETTARGFISDDDDHYRRDPYDVTAEDEKSGGFLRTQTPREELAGFLMSRFHCWRDFGNHRFAVEAVAWASALVPQNVYYRHTLNGALNDWSAALEKRRPPRFPIVWVAPGKRRFPPPLPVKIEQDVFAMQAMENLLNDERHDRALWTPLRNGRDIQAPVAAIATFADNGSCNIRFEMTQPSHQSFQVGFTNSGKRS